MSTVSKSDRNYWIKVLDGKIREKISALEEENKDRIEEFKHTIVKVILSKYNITNEEIKEYESLIKQYKEVEAKYNALIDKMGEIHKAMEKKILNYEKAVERWVLRYYPDSAIETIYSYVIDRNKKQYEDAFKSEFPEIHKLHSECDRIEMAIMFATTSQELREIVEEIVKSVDIKL